MTLDNKDGQDAFKQIIISGIFLRHRKAVLCSINFENAPSASIDIPDVAAFRSKICR